MKLGAENRKKAIAAIALLVVGGGLVLYELAGTRGGDAPPRVSASLDNQFAPSPHPGTTKAHGNAHARSIDPSLRFDLLKGSEDTKYAGTGRNIFTDQAEIPTPVASGRLVKKGPETPPPPPPPPPINLKFFGYANNPGEGKRIFLAQGEDVFIAHEGDIVDRRYKIVHIMPTSVEIEDVLNNNTQSIPLTLG